MAKFATIPITVASPVPDGECTSSYFVEYKLTGSEGYTLLNGVGTTFDNPIIIEPLVPSTSYDYRITRNCCNGQSAASTGTFVTDP